ncbi:MAG: 3-phosphoshikimate 1-carboxyvinyltransferase [Anaerolineales bacterium]|nr:3-phosphoshikimate 1-carboxyvinyltransferase [Anaerolineales bacterium]
MRLRVTGPASSPRGAISVPGDKSISHRGLLLAALASGPSRIRGLLRSGVTSSMLEALQQLGVDAAFVREDDLVVLGRDWRQPDVALDCGRSATTLRLLLGALAAQPLQVTLSGEPQLRRRPMGRVVEPLRRMGAHIQGANGGSQPPLQVKGSQLSGIEYHMDVASAQVKSALILAGLRAEGRTTIYEPGPARDHTERLLRSLGVPLRVSNGTIEVSRLDGPLPSFQLHVPGDLSSAAFPLVAAAAIPGGALHVKDVGLNPRRTGLLDALREMGARVDLEATRLEQGEPVGDVRVEAADLRAVRVAGDQVVRMIDEIPVLAVAMTQAQGESVVADAEELRVKESDRIGALAAELRKMGAEIETRPDGFCIRGPVRLLGAEVSSHGDHRLAMSLVVAGLLAEGETVIDGAEVIDESYPGFLDGLRTVGVEI